LIIFSGGNPGPISSPMFPEAPQISAGVIFRLKYRQFICGGAAEDGADILLHWNFNKGKSWEFSDIYREKENVQRKNGMNIGNQYAISADYAVLNGG
jgi:hypothetical protein